MARSRGKQNEATATTKVSQGWALLPCRGPTTPRLVPFPLVYEETTQRVQGFVAFTTSSGFSAVCENAKALVPSGGN